MPQKSSGGCYVATAVCGSCDAPEVMVLRQFRDERLPPTVLGRYFTALYYAVSPGPARHLPKHRTLSAWIRRRLDGVVDGLQGGAEHQ